MASIKVSGGYVGIVRALYPEYSRRESRDFRHIFCQLAFSRDARTWSRPAGREPFFTCGEEGAWDELLITPANPNQVGDTIFMLYQAGQGETRRAVGLTTIKRDRWAAIEPVHLREVLHTRPMSWANRELHINADATGGSVRAELVDVKGQSVPGYTLGDCDPFEGDCLDHRMSWKGVSQLPDDIIGAAYREGLPGRVMSIRFTIERARLYSFSC